MNMVSLDRAFQDLSPDERLLAGSDPEQNISIAEFQSLVRKTKA